MKFRDFLREQKEKHAVLAFGRMNPITSGHEKLVNKVKNIADKVGGSHHIVLSHSQDAKKNPLTADQKVKHAKRAFPGINFKAASKDKPTFFDHAEVLHKKGVTHLHMVGGSDRTEEYHKLLHKYNGTHEGARFNFKSIKVHSAGERDPDAEGVTGISASKMREHAKSGDLESFKKGAPSSMSHAHTKQMFNDVRKGMRLHEEIIREGVHDKGIFKAVFLGGGPGSGKDYVLSKTLDGHGLTEINSDKALEYLMDKEDLDKKMPDNEEAQRNAVRKRAKNVTELRQRLALHGRNGLIINGTGDDPEKYAKIKDMLEKLGYETSMIMVNTADEVSKERNIERGQRGGRIVPENIRKEKWQSVQAARPMFGKLFRDNYVEFDNSEDLRSAPPEVVEAKTKELDEIFKNMQKFVAKPPKNDDAKGWIATELSKKDEAPIRTDMKPHKDAGTHEQMNTMGLEYYGFGRYGKDGKVTHRSVHGSLVSVENNTKSVDKQFEEKEKKQKLLTDRNGKTRMFYIRGSAAKEAHQKNGTIQKVGKKYVVKLKEDLNEVHSPDNSAIEALYGQNNFTPSAEQLGKVRTSVGRKDRLSVNKPVAEERRIISLSSIKENFQKKIKESIDKGIESGISMTGAGESSARDMGEKLDKNGKATQVMCNGTKSGILCPKHGTKNCKLTELTGDTTTASIGDQKEDELKKKGISLTTFKKRNYI